MLLAALGCVGHSLRLDARALDRLFGPHQCVALPGFFDEALTAGLAADVDSLRARLVPAAASPAHGSVEWLSLLPAAPVPDASDDAAGLRARRALLALVDELGRQIGERSGTPLDAPCELKYAHYPCGGRYQRHVDGAPWASSRIRREYSFLLYLNRDWRPRDGGHLRLFDLGGGGGHVDVAPRAGTLVVFKSDVVPHEVRPTFARRLAVVGWLHRRASPAEASVEARGTALSPLARAIERHYAAKGKEVRIRKAEGVGDDAGD
jgi:SM-20-related protein